MIPIKGLQKMCLIDYPPNQSAMIYIGGCNFRCPYCHNAPLIDDLDSTPDISEEEILSFLKERKEWLDAVVITGGEPTLYYELKDFILKIKELGYLVKLDTNGSRPEHLKELLPIIDYIAMDIKGPIEKYDAPAQVEVDEKKIKESIEMIKNSNIDYEFRTTVLPEFFSVEDAYAIGRLLEGSKKYVLQQFRPGTTLDSSYNDKKGYSKEELENFHHILEKNIKIVEIRGVV